MDALRDIPIMLAAPIDRIPQGRTFEGWQAEPKYDGHRALALRGAQRTRLLSRRGTDLPRPSLTVLLG